jgi:hypothetical protein
MSEPMTIEQLVADRAQTFMPPEPEAESAPIAEAELEEQPDTTGDNAIEAEQPGDGVDEGQEPGEEETEAVEADPVDAPQWWDAEAKGKFGDLPPDVQAIVRAQEDKREAITQKAKQEAAEARKQASQEAEGFRSLAERLSQTLPKAEQAFQSRWEGMTPQLWSELAQADPQEAFRLKLEFDTEMAELATVRATEQQATKIAQEAHFAEQRRILTEKAPELAKDPETLRELGNYIVQSGIPPEAISQATADELIIVNKARLWDLAQAKAEKSAAAPKTKQPTPAPQKAVAPTARVPQVPAKQRQTNALTNRFNQTKSQADLVALRAAEWTERLKG